MRNLVIGLIAGAILLYVGGRLLEQKGSYAAMDCSGSRPMSGLAGQGSCWWQRDQDNRLRDVENDMRRFNGTMPR